MENIMFEDLFEGEINLDENMFNRKGHVGYIALAGRPNAGKSTLINSILGYHLTAVSSRPQTTRKHWKGFYTDEDSQLIFTDTPGIHEPLDKLGNSMKNVINRHIKEADVVVCIADAFRDHLHEDQMVVETLNKHASKIVLAVNKVDVATAEQRQETIDFFKQGLGGKVIAVVEISALKKDGITELLSILKKQLPVTPFIYDPDELTDVFERDIATELIQEAVFGSMRKEIPHGVMVKIDTWKEDSKKIRIDATIHTDREAHRKILVGKNGDQLQRIRKHAVQKIRDNIEKRIDLRMFVKVSPDWRNRRSMLEELGFEVK